MKGKLYLIPNTLGESALGYVLPPYNLEIINSINHYIVEDIRTARRFLSKCQIKTKIDDLQFYLLNKFTKIEELSGYLLPAINGNSIGIISEAGCPAVADPGAEIVRIAHDNDIEVVPLIGPSSILLALMASGFNGQKFIFNGYLPVKEEERIQQIKKDENRSKSEGITQIYIETPYRNMHLFKSMLNYLNPATRLCIAADLSLETQYIKSQTIKAWRTTSIDIQKKPAIFLFLA